MVNLGIIAALIGVSSYTIGDTSSKFVSKHFGRNLSSVDALGIGVIPLLVIFLILRPTGYLNFYQFGLIALASAFMAAGCLLIYKSLETEQVSNTMVLYGISPVMFVLFGVFALSESLSLLEIASIIALFAGALLVITDLRSKFDRKLLPAVLGEALWGVYGILILYAIRSFNGFMLPILISRSLAFAFASVYIILTKSHKNAKLAVPKRFGLKALSATVINGVGDGIGMLAFGFVFLGNVVALGGALLALEPAFIMLLGYLFYKDRWTRLQFAGFVVMIAGAVALSL